MLKTILLFVVASIFEVSGCYFIWMFIKQDKGIAFGVFGALFLVIYGLMASLHTSSFSKVFVIYGVVFIATSIVWSMLFERYELNRLDVVGICIVLVGAVVLYITP